MSADFTGQVLIDLLHDIADSYGDKMNGACPVCYTYTHKGWCFYPLLMQICGKPLDENDKKHLSIGGENDRT